MTKFPFEVPFYEVQANIEEHVSAVFSCLESEFLIMPKGAGFIDYAVFETGYEALKKATREFADVTPSTLLAAVTEIPISLLILRTILGFTPPEWAYVTTQRTGGATSRRAEHGESACRSAEIWGSGLHRRPRLWRQARGHEEVAVRHKRQGFHRQDAGQVN